jgi:amino acid transporter
VSALRAKRPGGGLARLASHDEHIGVVGALPWPSVAHSTSVASLVVTRNWGRAAAAVVTVLILITAMASVFAALLGGSRVPFHAAREGLFLHVFGRLHPRYDFPTCPC